MAKYRAVINTERGVEVSRLGRREIETHTSGWTKGVEVVCDCEGIKVYETGGSRDRHNKKLIWSDI